jgi:solute carrier family 4 (sodium bicarbonate transporter), member 10
MLVVMIGVRKSLDCIFTRRELKILDDIMPEMTKRIDDDLHRLEDGGNGEVGLFKKFVACCVGEKPEKFKNRKTTLHS